MQLDTYYNDAMVYTFSPHYHMAYVIGNNLYNASDGNENAFHLPKDGFHTKKFAHFKRPLTKRPATLGPIDQTGISECGAGQCKLFASRAQKFYRSTLDTIIEQDPSLSLLECRDQAEKELINVVKKVKKIQHIPELRQSQKRKRDF